MLRVEMHDATNALVMKLEGRLSGRYAEHVRSLVAYCKIAFGLVIDLTQVTYVDTAGESVLSLFGRMGAKFVAENAYSLDLCERLHLAVTRPAGHTRRREVRLDPSHTRASGD